MIIDFITINSLEQRINNKKVRNIPIGELINLGYLINWSKLFGGKK